MSLLESLANVKGICISHLKCSLHDIFVVLLHFWEMKHKDLHSKGIAAIVIFLEVELILYRKTVAET